MKNNNLNYQKIIENNLYIGFVLSISFLYFILFAIKSNFEVSGYFETIFRILDSVILVYVVLEFFLKIYFSLTNRQYREILSFWNVFDFLVIFTAIIALNVVWIRLLRVIFLLHLIKKVHVKLVKINESHLFQNLNITILLLFVLVVGLENTLILDDDLVNLFKILDFIIISYFFIEIAIKVLSKVNIIDYFYSNNKFNLWNLFDFIVVFLSFIPLEQLQGAATARVLRVIRILRLISNVPELKKIMKAVGYSFKSILYVLILLTIIFFVYGSIGVQFFNQIESQQGVPQLWNDLPTALLTLYRVFTFEGWTEVMYQAMEYYPIFGWVYFISFTILTSFILLNLFTGIIIDQIQMANSNILKFRLKDEHSELTEGIRFYFEKNIIFILNINNKISFILEQFDSQAKINKKIQKVVIILDDYEKVNSYTEGDLFLGSFEMLNISFVYADINYKETHHRLNLENASSVLILNDESKLVEGTVASDNHNVKIFTFLMNDKNFLTLLIYRFISYKRINCLIEVSSDTSLQMVKSIMRRNIENYLEAVQLDDSSNYSPDILVQEKFNDTKKILAKRIRKNSNYITLFPNRKLFSIVLQGEQEQNILASSIENFIIYKFLVEVFTFKGHIIRYFNSPYDDLSYKDLYLNWNEGVLLGISRKTEDGYIEPIIAPDNNFIVKKSDYLIVLSLNNNFNVDKSTNLNSPLDIEMSCNKTKSNVLFVDDGVRTIDLKKTSFSISNTHYTEYYLESNKLDSDIKENNIDTVIVNLEDDNGCFFVFWLLEKLPLEFRKNIIAILDNPNTGELLEKSHFEFNQFIIPQHLVSLFISNIAYNSHLQEVINQLKIGAFSDDSRIVRIRISSNGFTDLKHFKDSLFQKGYIYIASIRNGRDIKINDQNFNNIEEVIALKTEVTEMA